MNNWLLLWSTGFGLGITTWVSVAVIISIYRFFHRVVTDQFRND